MYCATLRLYPKDTYTYVFFIPPMISHSQFSIISFWLIPNNVPFGDFRGSSGQTMESEDMALRSEGDRSNNVSFVGWRE